MYLFQTELKYQYLRQGRPCDLKIAKDQAIVKKKKKEKKEKEMDFYRYSDEVLVLLDLPFCILRIVKFCSSLFLSCAIFINILSESSVLMPACFSNCSSYLAHIFTASGNADDRL